MRALTAPDWIVIALYGAVVLGVGWWANRRQKTSRDYFLGGGALPWWAVAASLAATSFSTSSLIGGTGFGHGPHGVSWFQLQIGDFLALGVVSLLFLPFFAQLRSTTAYEYLEKRFGVGARSVASVLFLVQTLLRTAILVYGPAVALQTLLGWSVEASIVFTALAAIVYSVSGGIAAVVWTDLIQLGVILVAVGACIAVVLADVPGGITAVVSHANRTGRLQVVSTEMQRGSIYNLVGAIVPYGVFALSLFGTGQQAVQRFLACKDLKAARRAAFGAWAAGASALGACLLLGVALAAWSELAPNAKDLGVDAEVLPAFVGERLPAGLAGLVLAAIFAASMSSIDSAIHSMSTCTLIDFVQRFSRTPPDDARLLRYARFVTGCAGVLAVGGALLAAESARAGGLLETTVTWLGYVAGPLLGLFLLGMLTRRVGQTAALIGVFVAAYGIALIVGWTDLATRGASGAWHPLWLAPASAALTCVAALLASLVLPRPSTERTSGLTVWTRAPRA